jgi:ABC-2 type transport system ATP-binding protein
MLVQGEHDFLFNENEAIATYLALKARGIPVEMIWQFGAHGYDGPLTGGGTNEGDLQGDLGAQGANPNDPQAYGTKYLPRRIIAWMDHYLRHTGVATGAEFSYFRDWIPYDHHGFAGPAFGDAAAYPAEGMEVLGLSGSDALVAPAQASQPGAVQLVNPPNGTPASFTEQPNFQAPDSVQGGASPWSGIPPSDPPGQVATFTSEPLIRDAVSVGGPTAHIHLRHSTGAADVTLFGKVFDIAPDGTATLVPHAPAPVRIPTDAAGGDVTADFKLLPFAHVFPSGHRVRFAIATTDTAMSGNRAPDVITLVQGGSDPATFSLPVDAGVLPIPFAGGTPGLVPGPLAALPNTSRPDVDATWLLAIVVSAGAVIAFRWRRRVGAAA